MKQPKNCPTGKQRVSMMSSIPIQYGCVPLDYWDGTIEFTSERSALGELINVTARWRGKDKIIISKPLMDDFDTRWAKLDGDILTACQFTLKVLAYFPDEQRYIAQRIYPSVISPMREFHAQSPDSHKIRAYCNGIDISENTMMMYAADAPSVEVEGYAECLMRDAHGGIVFMWDDTMRCPELVTYTLHGRIRWEYVS